MRNAFHFRFVCWYIIPHSSSYSLHVSRSGPCALYVTIPDCPKWSERSEQPVAQRQRNITPEGSGVIIYKRQTGLSGLSPHLSFIALLIQHYHCRYINQRPCAFPLPSYQGASHDPITFRILYIVWLCAFPLPSCQDTSHNPIT